MAVIFDGMVWTSYSQLWLVSTGAEMSEVAETFVGQSNGLCGGAVSGCAFLVTGTHTGRIPVRVQILDKAPSLGGWEEIVETTFTPSDASTGLFGWDGDASVTFNLPNTSYRLRWSASGMDAGKAQDLATDDFPAPDRYEISLWPAAPAPDSILRRTSDVAAGWHDHGFATK
jgi:hypothetical protein